MVVLAEHISGSRNQKFKRAKSSVPKIPRSASVEAPPLVCYVLHCFSTTIHYLLASGVDRRWFPASIDTICECTVQPCFPLSAPVQLFGGGGGVGAGGSTGVGVRRPDGAGGVPGIQYRELQHSLEHERDKNATLRQEILRLRDELHVSKAEGQSRVQSHGRY